MLLDSKIINALDIIETVIKTKKTVTDEPNTDEGKEEMFVDFFSLGTVLVIQRSRNL
jgi:hypothetical protein